MESQLGLLFAFVALLGWGFGDFFIQKTTRIIGVHKTYFLISAGATIVLFPFIYDQIFSYSFAEYRALALLSGIFFVYSFAIFAALQRGKLSIVESIIAFELPLTVALGVFIGGETMTLGQTALFFMIFCGIALAAATRLEHLHIHRRIFEKGAALAFLAAALSALTNFGVGTYSQDIDPLFVIWSTHAILLAFLALYMAARGEFRSLWRAVRAHPVPLFAQGVLDNVAWVGYALAASMLPISLTVTISESYIALAALLGYFFGRERLSTHQIAGILIAFVGVILLASTL